MDRRMAACLTMLAVSGLLGCADTPVQVAAPDVSAAVAGTDSVALTYICGNMFRIRNSSFEPRSVRWDIYNASPADTGSLWARGRDVGRTSVDFFVTSRTKGTMRLFVGATLVATKANGNKVACGAPVDATPLLPMPLTIRSNENLTVMSDSSVVSRTQISVKFDDTTSSVTQRSFQRTFAAQYLGGAGRFRSFRIPDIGSQPDTLDAFLSRLRAAAGVQYAVYFLILGPSRNDGGRFPDDGSGYRRGDYVSKNSRVWAATSLRLPQAWWCETGEYSSGSPRIAILEQNFAGEALPDFSASVSMIRLSQWKADTAVQGGKPSQAQATKYRNHGAAVASVLAASGDNGVGVAGMLWRSALTVLSMENTDSARSAGVFAFNKYGLDRLIASQPQVLSLSSDFGPYASVAELEAQADQMFLGLDSLMRALPNLIVMKSAANDTIVSGAYDAASLSKRTAILTALLRLRDDPRYAGRIVIVGATSRNNNRATFSNNLKEVDVYAPGVDIPVLLSNGNVTQEDGTSFSTPIVAGIAGQLLAMDPSLSAADLKALLLAGARDSVENSNGDNVAPNPVGNTTDVVYEADAYGSLRLLSALAGGRPLCGATVDAVRAQLAPPGEDHKRFSVVAQFYGGTSEVLGSTDSAGDSLLYPGTPFGTQLSVAPGGRSFSVTSVTPQEDSRANMFRLQNRVWTAADRIDGSFGVLFGERDTLLLSVEGAVIATAGSGRLPIAPFPTAGSGPGFLPGGFSFAPDGSAYTVTTEYADIAAPNDVRVVRRSGTTTALQGSPTLYGSVRTAWLPDSRSIIVSRVRELNAAGTMFESTLTRLSVGSASLSVQQQGIVATGANTGVAAVGSSDEGGRTLFRISGPFFTIDAEVDCSIQSVRTGTLNDVRVVRQLRPGVCGASTPPGGGGGQEGRVAGPPGVVSLRINNGAAARARALNLREHKGLR
jgi:hypothetical protein